MGSVTQSINLVLILYPEQINYIIIINNAKIKKT